MFYLPCDCCAGHDTRLNFFNRFKLRSCFFNITIYTVNACNLHLYKNHKEAEFFLRFCFYYGNLPYLVVFIFRWNRGLWYYLAYSDSAFYTLPDSLQGLYYSEFCSTVIFDSWLMDSLKSDKSRIFIYRNL